MNDGVSTRRVPWHFWVVAILGLVWNLFGVVDYVMTETRNAAYLAQFPAEVMAMIDAMPAWAVAAWACGVWGSLAGSILLVIRSRFAVAAFAVSLAGLAISTVYQATGGMPEALRTTGMMAMNVLIWALLIFQLWYAWQARRSGLLR